MFALTFICISLKQQKVWEFVVLCEDNLFGSAPCPFNHFLSAARVKEIGPIKFEY